MKTEKEILYCMTDGIPNELAMVEDENKTGHTGKPKSHNYTSTAERVLQIAKHCERISKRGGDHADQYHRIAQHLKKSAGHLRALERTK